MVVDHVPIVAAQRIHSAIDARSLDAISHDGLTKMTKVSTGMPATHARRSIHLNQLLPGGRYVMAQTSTTNMNPTPLSALNRISVGGIPKASFAIMPNEIAAVAAATSAKIETTTRSITEL